MTSLNTADQDSFLTPGSRAIPILGPPLVPGFHVFSPFGRNFTLPVEAHSYH